MKIAIFQMDTTWEAPQWNIEKAALWVEGLDAEVELCVLPEMFATGFSMNPERIAQRMDGEIVTQMTDLALRTGKALIFSAAIEDTDRHTGKSMFYNRLFFIAPDGTRLVYNKRHLFRMAGEHKHYGEGDNHMVIHYKGWRIATYICYDLRFPVWSRKSAECDLAVYIASWPEPRSYAWSTLLRARAIENLCYTVGVNRSGDDPANHYSGDSVILDYMGMPLAQATPSL
ncbi:MAG: nitrilase-related carbon-nitrogen hydrolase, partial [Rikenellaceae bacterium]